MPRTLLIDDEADARSTLRHFLADSCPNLEVVGEAAGVGEGLERIQQASPELVFLDVQMPDGSGFDLLDKLPDVNFHLIFTTAHDRFAVQAFRYNAFDFLLKPINPMELQSSLHRFLQSPHAPSSGQVKNLLETQRTNRFDKIALASRQGIHLVRISEISHLEGEGNYTHVFLTKGDALFVTKPLRDLEELLPSSDFFRTHQSHLINLHYLAQISWEDGNYLIMENGEQVPLARRRKDELLRRIS
jgi:two-component system LytT family response regulator